MNNKELESLIDQLRLEIDELKLKKVRVKGNRNYGPKSTRKTTEDDAMRIKIGDLKDKSVNEICIELGLSRGQVYSIREGYTFKSPIQSGLDVTV